MQRELYALDRINSSLSSDPSQIRHIANVLESETMVGPPNELRLSDPISYWEQCLEYLDKRNKENFRLWSLSRKYQTPFVWTKQTGDFFVLVNTLKEVAYESYAMEKELLQENIKNSKILAELRGTSWPL